MTSGGDIRSERHARAILKLAESDPPSVWRAAFQREVKAAHPDRGGDSERVRLVIEAYRFLKTVEPAPPRRGPAPERPQAARPGPRAARSEPPPKPQARSEPPPRSQARPESPPPEPEPPREQRIAISIIEAFRGGETLVRLGPGKRFRVRLPAGLQTGDVVRFGADGQHRLAITVEPLPRAELKGADLWLTVQVSREFLKEGGRIELDTPLGPRKFWVSRTSAARGVYRAPGEGLPARPSRAKGCLFMRFELDETLGQSPAKSLLAKFAAAWAGH
jgi:curved DNA-binding protein